MNMTIDELRQLYTQADETDPRGPGYITIADVANMIEPGLARSSLPTTGQCQLLAAMMGRMYRDDGWFRSTAAASVAALLKQCCDFGMPLYFAADLVQHAVQVGANEYAG